MFNFYNMAAEPKCSPFTASEHGDHFVPDRIEQTEVVVVGNGPSAITLSFMLSGHWPYYCPSDPHPIEYLHNRMLHHCRHRQSDGCSTEEPTSNLSKSLIESDLSFLSNGLSGRSLNRVSILFDQLQNPNTDFGSDQRSTLRWVYKKSNQINHIVLGTGLPGGIWHSMTKGRHKGFKNILTVSRRRWMQLPELDIFNKNDSTSKSSERVTFDTVAEYYRNYVSHFELNRFFRNHTRVLHIERNEELKYFIVDTISKMACSSTHSESHTASSSNCIQAHDKHTGKSFSKEQFKSVRIRYHARKVVLASGNSTTPTMLNVPGENHSFVIHSLDQLGQLIKNEHTLLSSHKRKSFLSDPVLIIGSGLSAADALTMLTNRWKRPVRAVHIFRRSINDRALIFNQLNNENTYPEYHKVYNSMKQSIKSPLCLTCLAKAGQSQMYYQAYQRCTLSSINGTTRVALLDFLDKKSISDHNNNVSSTTQGSYSTEPNGRQCSKCHQLLWHQASLKVSLILILIGSKPQLDYLPPVLLNNLGIHKGVPIDQRYNPIDIDLNSHQCLAMENLYAIGPLVGDNFVRFVQGGALAVASDIWKSSDAQRTNCDNTNL